MRFLGGGQEELSRFVRRPPARDAARQALRAATIIGAAVGPLAREAHSMPSEGAIHHITLFHH
ncbi:hypothetical protein AC244_33160 [Ensifer adhaerens]|uniref:Uncharacterized protein n=1 Tax=Ensifer adhaerens TaxID=106592 RepID=A0A0L8BE69_ENSAD|nr:hypothetical protein AC244_33160 [Ensifer adhaerens]